MEKIRLLIVDDHPVVRTGLKGMLSAVEDFDLIGEAADGAEAVELSTRLDPDVILMDLKMPGMDGVTAIRAITDRTPDQHILVLTTYDSDADILPAIEAGATGYLLKDTPRDELFRAIRAAARGARHRPPTPSATSSSRRLPLTTHPRRAASTR